MHAPSSPPPLPKPPSAMVYRTIGLLLQLIIFLVISASRTRAVYYMDEKNNTITYGGPPTSWTWLDGSFSYIPTDTTKLYYGAT